MLSLYSRAVRLSIQGPRFVGPVISRGKKKKAGKKSGGAPADVDPEVAAMVDLPKYEASMQKTIETLQTNFSRIRSGGASPAMLDGTYSIKTKRKHTSNYSGRILTLVKNKSRCCGRGIRYFDGIR